MASKSTTAERVRASAEPGTCVLVCLLAWAVPGAAHFWLGWRQKAVVFFVALMAMFVIGLALNGRIFPFELGEPLVALAAIADFGLGLPWIAAHFLGLGGGIVTAVTHESGNTFLIVAGLLNFLIILDAFDLVTGRK
jgi:hypothetical protein